jgi:NADH-quinone oxidoreductase subunit K
MIPNEHVIGLALLLFVLAIASLLLRRSLIALLAGVQGIFVSVALALVGFARMHAGPAGDEATAAAGDAVAFAMIILVVAAAQLAVGLGIVVAFVRKRRSVNVESASVLRW